MTFSAKLNLKFYIVFCLLLCFVVIAWYGIYFLNANEILMEDNNSMDSGTKAFFTAAMTAVAVSWTLSLIILFCQTIKGVAFRLDEDGIHITLSAVVILAFIFVVPIKRIPYEAIEHVSENNGVLSLKLDKSKIDALLIFKPFVRREYHFLSGFTKEKTGEIRFNLNKFIEARRDKAE